MHFFISNFFFSYFWFGLVKLIFGKSDVINTYGAACGKARKCFRKFSWDKIYLDKLGLQAYRL